MIPSMLKIIIEDRIGVVAIRLWQQNAYQAKRLWKPSSVETSSSRIFTLISPASFAFISPDTERPSVFEIASFNTYCTHTKPIFIHIPLSSQASHSTTALDPFKRIDWKRSTITYKKKKLNGIMLSAWWHFINTYMCLWISFYVYFLGWKFFGQ